MSSTGMQEDIAANVRWLQARIASLAADSGRAPGAVRLVAVTKTQDWARVAMAIKAGAPIIGENRYQEARDKLPEAWVARGREGAGGGEAGSGAADSAAGDCPRVACHFIGHLQKNKVKKAVALFDCIQSVDDLETLALISREARQLGRTMDVLFEVNTSGEDSKQGVRSLDDLRRLVAAGLELPAIRLRGLMTIGPLGGDEPAVRRAFAGLAGDFRRLAGEFGLTGGAEDGAAGTGAGGAWSELSMGMSGDYPWAIAEGASLVRIGTAIFGPRLGGRLA